MRIVIFALRSDLVETDHLGRSLPDRTRSLSHQSRFDSLSLSCWRRRQRRLGVARRRAWWVVHSLGLFPRVRPGTHSWSGRLPLVQCSLCQTSLLECTSQTSSNPGKKFFKCPKNENLLNHCKFFMWEDKYEAYLVDNSLFPFDIGSPDDGMIRVPAAAASMEALLDELKVVVNEVQEAIEEMKGVIVEIPPVLTAMRNTMNGMYGEMKRLRFGMDGNVAMVNKNSRLRERMIMLGWSIVFLLVVILVVSLKK